MNLEDCLIYLTSTNTCYKSKPIHTHTMPITFNTTLTISELEHELERHEPEGEDYESEVEVFEHYSVREAASTEIPGMIRHRSKYLCGYPKGGFYKWGFYNKENAIMAFHQAKENGIQVSGITFQKRYCDWIWSVRGGDLTDEPTHKRFATWSWIPE